MENVITFTRFWYFIIDGQQIQQEYTRTEFKLMLHETICNDDF